MGEIVITEKTSQAKDVRAAVGSHYGPILPAEGHLLDLQEPEDANPQWKKWSVGLLRPEGLYETVPAKGGNKASKLTAIRRALKGAERVWIATDCDREGQLIGQEILDHYRYRGKVMRVLFTAQDPKTIRDAFRQAKPNSEFRRLYESAVARREADQICNLSLTRTATVALGQGRGSVIGIGRVKTPTLGIVCQREIEILNFVPTPYFEVVAWAKTGEGKFRVRHAPREKILRREDAVVVAKAAEGFEGPLSVKVENRKQRPPLLHDLPSLQKLCSARFGWSASKTLDVAQELYDGEGKKVLTYPRAEVRYLPESAIEDVGRIISGLRQGPAYAAIPLPKQPVIRKGRGGTFYDKAVEGASHHAIVPNVNMIAEMPKVWGRLSNDERLLFDIVARSYFAAVMPDYEYRRTTVSMDVKGHEFMARGHQPTKMGWKEAFRSEEDSGKEKTQVEREDAERAEAKQTLPPLRNGQPARLDGAEIESKKTRPPPRYSEGALIDAMKNAWKFVSDKQRRERLKEAKGIGTPATRAEIIKVLKKQGDLVLSRKNIKPTERGLALYNVLAETDPTLVDPGQTAEMEFLLDDVVTGRREMMSAIDGVCEAAMRSIGRIAERAKQEPGNGVAALQKERAPSAKMKKFAKSLAESRGLKLPKGYSTSMTICREFLDAHAPKREGQSGGNGAGPRVPSDKQLAFAQSIAQEKDLEIPEKTLADAVKLSRWIDANKSKGRRGGRGNASARAV